MKRIPKEVLCSREIPEGTLPWMRETKIKVCQIEDGRGSCGKDFFEEDGSYCRWCVQILCFKEDGE